MSLKIVYKKPGELKQYENNARLHNDKQVEQIVASIEEFGFTNPILIDENNGVIAGHGRLMASERLNLDKVPCIVLKDLTETQKKAYVIADNKLALNATWDEELLKSEIESLMEFDFDINLLGFEIDELDMVLNGDTKNEDIFEEEQVQSSNIEKFILKVECANETDLQQLKEELLKRGYRC